MNHDNTGILLSFITLASYASVLCPDRMREICAKNMTMKHLN